MIAVAAISGAVLFSAFKSKQVKPQLTEQWYAYDGDGDRTLAENYQLVGSSSPSCSGSEEVCAIRAMDNGFEQPIITSELATEINAAVANELPSANVNLFGN